MHLFFQDVCSGDQALKDIAFFVVNVVLKHFSSSSKSNDWNYGLDHKR